MNVFLSALGRLCEERPLEEKRLLAPSLRIAHQWVESLARSGTAALNLRPATLGSLALELAQPGMRARDARLASDLARTVLVGRAWARAAGSPAGASPPRGGGYLSRLEPTYRLVETLRGAVDSLRLAGLGPEELARAGFEAEAKGRELSALLANYLDELRLRSLVDYAEALRLAARSLASGEVHFEGIVVLPSDLRLRRLERELLTALPRGRVVELPVDEPAGPAADAPSGETASGRSEMTAFVASGHACEVREVLRLVLDERLSLDEVELLHTDYETYVPIVHETLLSLGLPAGKEGGTAGVPATFAEGLPVRLSRPGRALSAWLRWVSEGYQPAHLASAISDGLLDVPGMASADTSFASLAGTLADLRIPPDRDRYLAALKRPDAGPGRVRRGRDDDGSGGARARDERRSRELELLRRLVEGLLELSPPVSSTPEALFAGASRLVREKARVADEFDAISRDMLAERIDEMSSLLAPAQEAGLDVRDWLDGLPGSLRSGGSGPRPGMLHVAGIFSGGHSGRPRTFIVGLDDGRMPSAAIQDPILLDAERSRLSRDLLDSRRELEERELAFRRLCARLRGRVTFSYSSRDIAREREAFPSRAFVSVAGGAVAAPLALPDGLPNPPQAAAFVPPSAERALDEGEWWLWRLLCAAKPEPASGTRSAGEGGLSAVARRFQHLAAGLEAERMRGSAAFTVFDGRLPDPGAALDPLRSDGPPMSATRLEALGRCPFSYFLEYVLALPRPEPPPREPEEWLGPLESGELLHEVFRRFLAELVERGERPERARHARRLMEILREEIDARRRESPPRSEFAFRRECGELEHAARIFLAEEERAWGERVPVYLEAAIGCEQTGPPTEMDSPEPEQVKLPGGGAIRARGRLDRVDRDASGREHYSVWDYKTGSPSPYRRGGARSDPFDGGRRLQPALYLALAEARLRRLSPRASVRLFGYFFPGLRGRGERVRYSREELGTGLRVIELLCELARRGAYVQTDSASDCERCGFSEVCGDASEVARRTRLKLCVGGDPVLAPFRELRGLGGKDEEEGD